MVLASSFTPRKMRKESKQRKEEKMVGFSSVNDDILQNILSRLPASSFAFSACVNKGWNKVCERILSRPKLATALSLNPSLHEAVAEVLDNVLSAPIRPQFAIASVGVQFSLEEAHQLITEKLGSDTPVITNAAFGIIGRDVATNKMKEVRWNYAPDEESSNPQGSNTSRVVNRGIILIVGFLPGMKVDIIPLLRPNMEYRTTLIDNFLMDIREFTAHFSGSIAPTGIIMFGELGVDLTPVLAEFDYGMPESSVVVGDAGSRFLCKGGGIYQNYMADMFGFDAVALVFARDKNKPHGIGEYRFHTTLSTGVVPFGPVLQAVSVAASGNETSFITVRMNGDNEILYIQSLLGDIDEMVLKNEDADLYIGVTQKRPSPIEPEKMELRKYLALYEVIGGELEYLVLDGVGIKPGDKFLFYHSDSGTAALSCLNAFENLKALKEAMPSSRNRYGSITYGDVGGNSEVFGGLMFACPYSGDTSYYDSFPFCSNFPGAPLGGIVCNQQIGRDTDARSPARCSLHVWSNVYLAMSYHPPSPNPYYSPN